MKVILQEDVPHLGQTGEVVKVKDGYARNYLVPRGLAVMADDRNVKQLEHHMRLLRARAARRSLRPRSSPEARAGCRQHQAGVRRRGQALRLGQQPRHRRGAGRGGLRSEPPRHRPRRAPSQHRCLHRAGGCTPRSRPRSRSRDPGLSRDHPRLAGAPIAGRPLAFSTCSPSRRTATVRSRGARPSRVERSPLGVERSWNPHGRSPTARKQSEPSSAGSCSTRSAFMSSTSG